jgi:hypothetical protein
MESVDEKNVFTWVENGNIVILKPQGIKEYLGKGQLPVTKAIGNDQVFCVWENDKKIYKAVLGL